MMVLYFLFYWENKASKVYELNETFCSMDPRYNKNSHKVWMITSPYGNIKSLGTRSTTWKGGEISKHKVFKLLKQEENSPLK